MRYPGCVIVTVLETISYDTWLTITRFPCSATIRQELANNLVDVGFIYLGPNGYGLTELGETFLNNLRNRTTI